MLTRPPFGPGSFCQAAESGVPASINGEVTESLTQLVPDTQRPARLLSWKIRFVTSTSNGSVSNECKSCAAAAAQAPTVS